VISADPDAMYVVVDETPVRVETVGQFPEGRRHALSGSSWET
jgi:hypothetical protein